jgi:hypothetical protein
MLSIKWIKKILGMGIVDIFSVLFDVLNRGKNSTWNP